MSGYLFTGTPGQTVTGTNPGSSFGSRDPLLIGTFDIPVPPGTYTVEVESLSSAFQGGSGVGPLDPPVPSPGPPEFWDLGESDTESTSASNQVTVSAGAAVTGIDIILNGTPTRFDQFESARLWLREPLPAWIRKGLSTACRMLG